MTHTKLDLNQLLIHEEIRQLVARYAVAIAKRDLDTVVNLFVEDVRVAPGVVGREHLRAFLSPGLEAMPVTMLITGTHQIDVESPTRARGTLLCKGEMGDSERWVHQLIVYEDTYECRREQWYFQRRKHTLVYGQEQDLKPMAQPPANWPEREVGRGTAPMQWPGWQAFYQRDDL